MAESDDKTRFFRDYDLVKSRKQASVREPAPHQNQALQKLDRWYADGHDDPHGGILVLPTGGGKTFCAVHFLCRHPLSEKFKVLWLAHTHHLLEQAFVSFEHGIPLIAEPKANLTVRVVSGTIGHFPVHSIESTDDVLIASLQSTSRAFQNNHEQLIQFLDSTAGKLCVVFDEAHHAPAPSYRTLLTGLRGHCAEMKLLGLTATPTYADERKRGWLSRLFPQGIVAQAEPQRLMADGVLAKPILEEAQTSVAPEFDESDYHKWVGTYRDLPERIIHELATNNARNDSIVNYYVADKERFGKTIIFADRWYQCERLREGLRKRDVRADVIYSHVAADPQSVEARRRRGADENSKVLQQFRDDELDVLINVRMLTEGTDIPNVQSIFLTRQTTSQILLTQMVGRALRGPKFHGTDKAYIVSFIDDWRHRINWASYDQIAEGLADENVPEYGKRPPLQLISIDIVRRLSRQMDSGINVNPGPYKTFLPLGWYRVEFDADVQGTDDVEPVRLLIMVFAGQEESYTNFIDALCNQDISQFGDTSIREDEVAETLDAWKNEHFGELEEFVGTSLTSDLFAIARHLAQNELERPRFFPFEARNDHDLDSIAKQCVDQDFGPRMKDQALRGEYGKGDRYWRIIYPQYDLFKSHCNACEERILHAEQHGANPEEHRPVFSNPQAVPDTELDEEIKAEVKAQDGHRCVCCGNTKNLQVDHISPRYLGGQHHRSNLQTLCKVCNRMKKGTERIDFRPANHCTSLTMAPATVPEMKMLSGKAAKQPEKWEMVLRRFINFFYRCSAVERIEIGAKMEGLRHWKVWLFAGNDPNWLAPHLPSLAERIRKARSSAKVQPAPDTIEIVG